MVRGVKRPPDAPRSPPPDHDGGGAGGAWLPLAVGIVAAVVLQPLLPCMFGWFLAAIPHELGHATIGCLLGRPAAPAISLAGHAWTGIQDRHDALVAVMMLALGAAAYSQRAVLLRAILLGLAALLLPALAFTDLGEIAIAAAGHLGELAFAAWCYAVCWHGGYTGALQERIAGAFAGAMLQGGNLRLCFGLLTDAGARSEYGANGSLGLKNDMLVLAEDLCSCRLQSVALGMFVVALLALPLGLWWGARRQHHGFDSGD